jgi:hypothetical protein
VLHVFGFHKRACCSALSAILVAMMRLPCGHAQAQTAYLPGHRTVNDAHNCYPYDGRWNDRIERALATGFPVAIEQDLNWLPATASAPGRVVVGHGSQHTAITRGGPLSGSEPEFESYFFDSVRPAVERALRSNDHSRWPIITLNLDLKGEQPEILDAVWSILQRHRQWLTHAVKNITGLPARLVLGPILVLNGPSDKEQAIFYDRLAPGEELLTFGAVHTNMHDPAAAPDTIETEPVSNYRRWWNNPWNVVEPEGQSKAGEWTAQAAARLQQLTLHAHRQGLWIRFYTLDGATERQQLENGWFRQYNFRSHLDAEQRWHAAINAHVDFLASDEYEAVASLLR